MTASVEDFERAITSFCDAHGVDSEEVKDSLTFFDFPDYSVIETNSPLGEQFLRHIEPLMRKQ